MRFFLPFILSLLMSCATGIQVGHYPVEAANISAIRALKNPIKSITYASQEPDLLKNAVRCRGFEGISLGDMTALRYLEKALQDEFSIANVMHGQGKDLQVEILRLEDFSDSGNSRWEVDAVLKYADLSQKISYVKKYEWAFNGLAYCKYASAGFEDLVVGFNRKIIDLLQNSAPN